MLNLAPKRKPFKGKEPLTMKVTLLTFFITKYLGQATKRKLSKSATVEPKDFGTDQ